MDAFDTAVIAIFRDPNLSRPAIYNYGLEDDLPCRVSRHGPAEEFVSGGIATAARGISIRVPVAWVPTLRENATFTVYETEDDRDTDTDGEIYRVRSWRLNPARKVWICDVDPVTELILEP